MPIELLCPGCSQQLRVPDTAAGKNAKCPKCSTILSVPAAGNGAGGAPTSGAPATGASGGLSPLTPLSSGSGGSSGGGGLDFGPAAGGAGGSFSSPPPKNPFGEQATDQVFGGGGGGWQDGGSVNPYASPAGVTQQPRSAGPVGHQYVEIGPILNHAVNVWQNNLGVLVGSTFIAGLLMFVANMVGEGAQRALMMAGEPALVILGGLVFGLLNFAWQTYLGVGQAQIAIRAARGQPVDIGDLFKGAARFPAVFGFLLLCGLVVYIPLLVMAAIAGGLGIAGGGAEAVGLLFLLVFFVWVAMFIAVTLFFWPSYYLVVDERSRVFPSFGIAATITEGNKLTTFLMWIISFGIMVLGVLALCIGLLFAAPLVSVMWATAYLMMSGQIPVTSVPKQQSYDPQRPQRFQ